MPVAITRLPPMRSASVPPCGRTHGPWGHCPEADANTFMISGGEGAITRSCVPMYPHRKADWMMPCEHAHQAVAVMLTRRRAGGGLLCAAATVPACFLVQVAKSTDRWLHAGTPCAAMSKPNSLAMGTIATLRTMRSMLHRASATARGTVVLRNAPPAMASKDVSMHYIEALSMLGSRVASFAARLQDWLSLTRLSFVTAAWASRPHSKLML